MAVIYASTLRTSRMDAVLTAIGNAGKIKGYTSGDVLVATWALPTPSGSVSGDVLTFDVDPDINATLATTGTITKATITTAADAVVVSGLTVGTSGTNLVMSSNVVGSTGDTVTLQTATLTHNTAG
jgi:hypothetical protein